MTYSLRHIHRGTLLSPTLDEPGGYGYLVEAVIPRRIVASAPNGRLVIRLTARKTGLAVYGREAGRYPFGPHIR